MVEYNYFIRFQFTDHKDQQLKLQRNLDKLNVSVDINPRQKIQISSDTQANKAHHLREIVHIIVSQITIPLLQGTSQKEWA